MSSHGNNDDSFESDKIKISDLGGACKDLFLECAEKHHWPQDVRDRSELLRQLFHIWASNFGVFASNNAALDKRLEYSDMVRDLILQLLSLMKRNLKFIVYSKVILSSQETLIFIGENGSGKIQGTASEALDAIEATISRLNRLSTTIRKSSSGDLENRIMNFAKKYPDAKYPQLALKVVQFRYMTAMSSLHHQLAISMVNRRQRLRYSRRHQLKLRAETPAKSHMEKEVVDKQPTARMLRPLPAIPEHIDTNATGKQGGPVQTRQRQLDKNPASRIFERRQKTYSDTNVSGHGYRPTPSEFIRLQRDGGSVISSSRNSSTFLVEDLEGFPIPPKMDGLTYPSCPYCGKLLNQSELEIVNWRRHVLEDIQPFICISEECDQPFYSFKDFDSWAKHMRESHSVKWTQQVHKPITWRCDVDHPKVKRFEDEDAFKKHLGDEHYEYTPAQQEAICISGKVTRRRPRNVCPMCNVDVAALAAIESRAGNKSSKNLSESEQLYKLAKHIAGHLRLLAFDSVNNLDTAYDDISEITIDTNENIRHMESIGPPLSGAKYLSSVKLDRPERPAMFLWRIVLTRVVYQLLSTKRLFMASKSEFDVDWSDLDLADLSRREFLSFKRHYWENPNAHEQGRVLVEAVEQFSEEATADMDDLWAALRSDQTPLEKDEVLQDMIKSRAMPKSDGTDDVENLNWLIQTNYSPQPIDYFIRH